MRNPNKEEKAMDILRPISLDEGFNRQVWKRIKRRRGKFLLIALLLSLFLLLTANLLIPRQEPPFVFYIQAKSTSLGGKL